MRTLKDAPDLTGGRLAWWLRALTALTLLALPVLVLGMGFRPGDACVVQAAKAASGHAWGDILVLRPDLGANPQAAWEGLLRAGWLATHWGPQGLAALCAGGLFALVLLAPLPWLKAPEAWLASWVLLWLAEGRQGRLMQGLPFLVPVAVLLGVCCLWLRGGGKLRFALTLLAFGAAALARGGTSLVLLIPVAFLLAGRVREAKLLALAWGAGTLLAALGSGHPGSFLWNPLQVGGTPAAAAMAGEAFAYSSMGQVGLCLLWVLGLRLREGRPGLAQDPLFLLWAGCWLAGLVEPVFWVDAGCPCAALWLAFQLEPSLVRLGGRAPGLRLAVAGFCCLAALLLFSADVSQRWSGTGRATGVRLDGPDLAGWLPDRGGILYAITPEAFTETFRQYPTAPWRYMVGLDPSLMPAADMAVYRRIRGNPGNPSALLPWVRSMRPEDRLWLRSTPPGAGQFGLAWHSAGDNVWLGRLPRKD